MTLTQKQVKGRRGYTVVDGKQYPVVWHRSARTALKNDKEFNEAPVEDQKAMIVQWCLQKLDRDGLTKKTSEGDKIVSSGEAAGMTFGVGVDTRNYVLSIGNDCYFYSTIDQLYCGIVNKVTKSVLCEVEGELSVSQMIQVHKKVLEDVVDYIGMSKKIVSDALNV